MKFKHRVIMTVSMLLAMVILFLVEIRLATIPDSGKTGEEKNGEKVADKEDNMKGPPAGVGDEKAPTLDPRANLPHILINDPRFGLDLGHRGGAERLNQGLNNLLSRLNRTGIQGPPLPPHDLILENLPKQKPFLPDDSNDPFTRLRNESVGPESYKDKINNVAARYQEKKKVLARKISDVVVKRLSDYLDDKLGDVGRVGDEAAVPVKDSPEVAWEIWQKWVKPDYLYPENAFWSDEMNQILTAMATAPITSFGVGHKGTQLKATVMLGEQKTAFKPMRYPRNEVITGVPYAGFDRHNGEIAGFHLDGILGFRIAPPVVGRRVNLTALKPVTSDTLMETFIMKDGNTCFYGKCYYCKPEEAACAEGEVMEGAVTLWLPEWYQLKTWRHPYQRSYRPGFKAKWEQDTKYCQQLLKPSSDYYYGILEFTETAIFDFLMGNADRHHYETFAKAENHGRLMHIDSAKSFGNPLHDETSVLAPLVQCCRLRESTWQRLQALRTPEEGPLSKALNESLKRDPVFPILTPEHLVAVDRRHSITMQAVEQCIKKHGRDRVIVASWPPR